MRLSSPNLADSSFTTQQSYSSPPAAHTHRRRQRGRNNHPPSVSTSHSLNTDDAEDEDEDEDEDEGDEEETQALESLSSLPPNSLPSSSSPKTSVFVPLPLFRGFPGECPVSHLTNFARIFRSPSALSLNFPITLIDDAALWYDLEVGPRGPCSWDETKSAFLRAFRRPNLSQAARAELVSLRQGDSETVNSYHLRTQWIIRRCPEHGMTESLLSGIFVEGLREELRERVARRRPETVREAARLAAEWEGATECMKQVEEEQTEGEQQRLRRIGSVTNGRRPAAQCQCWKHQCWKKYGRTVSATVTAAADTATPSIPE